MIKELDEVKAKFLSPDLDEEERADNEARINEWQKDLIENEAFLLWQSHDISKNILSTLKASYKEIGLRLSVDRKLTEEQRYSLWAKQDACAYFIELMDRDTKGVLERIEKEIKNAINAT